MNQTIRLRRQSSHGNDIEGFNGYDDPLQVGSTTNTLLEKVAALQNRNIQLETVRYSLNAQLEILRERLEKREKEETRDAMQDDPLMVAFSQTLKSRSLWLIGLLLLQSCSSYILQANSAVIQRHPKILIFLTMLVCAFSVHFFFGVIHFHFHSARIPLYTLSRSEVAEMLEINLVLLSFKE